MRVCFNFFLFLKDKSKCKFKFDCETDGFVFLSAFGLILITCMSFIVIHYSLGHALDHLGLDGAVSVVFTVEVL